MINQADLVGCIGSAVVLLAVLYAAYYIYNKFQRENMKVTPSPIETEPPASNAPVLGEPKQIITPMKYEETSKEMTANYTLADEMVVKWDLIPSSARVVTIGIRMSNPPITGMDNHNKKTVRLIATEPATMSGFGLSFMDRGKYSIMAGRGRDLEYLRDTSDFDMNEERFAVRFTQISMDKTRIDIIYNGEVAELTSSRRVPVSEIRKWPQQLKIFRTDKIQNVWVTYG